ncbi:MAG: O-antigen ligase family protein, partial [Candidatus Sumerlaeota bacterium]
MARSRKKKKKSPKASQKPTLVREKSDSWLFWGAMVMTALVTFPGMIAGNYLPKSVWAAFWIGLGLIFIRRPRDEEADRATGISPLALLWLAYLGWALLSLLWAPSWPTLLMRFSSALLVPTGAYLLARYSRFWKTPRSWQLLSAIVVLVTLIGGLQLAASLFLSEKFVERLFWFFPGSNIPRGTLGNRNYASMFLSVSLPFLFFAFYRAGKRPERRLHALSILGTCVFLLIARTRGAWLALFFAGVAVFMAYASMHDWRRALKKIVLPAAGVLLLLSVALSLFPATAFFGEDKATVFSTLRHFFRAPKRLERWTETLEYVQWPLGSGYGNFAIHATDMRGDTVMALHTDIHNDYLQNLLDLGIPGAALFIAFFGLALWQAWRGRRDPLVLAAGCSVVVIAVMQLTTFTMEKVSSQVMAASAIAVINARSHLKWGWTWPGGKIRKPHLLRVALGIFILCIAVAAFLNAWSDMRIRRWLAREGAMRQYNVAIHELDRISRTVIHRMFFDANATHLMCHELQKASTRLEQFQQAERFAKKCLALHPNDHVAWGTLAKVAMERGNEREAVEYLDRAASIANKMPEESYGIQALRLRVQLDRDKVAEIAEDLERQLREQGKIDNPYSPLLRHLVGMYVHLKGEYREKGVEIWSRAGRHILEPLNAQSPLPYEVLSVEKPLPPSGSTTGNTHIVLRWQGPPSVRTW